MSEPTTDPAAARANAADVRRIYGAEVDFVWNYLRRLGVAERDLPDLVHDVFVVLCRRLAEFDPNRPARPWLAGIAARLAANYRRSSKQTREVVRGEIATADDRPTPEHEAAAAQTRRIALAALDTLDDDRRAVLVLHDLEGFSAPEISAALAVPLNTVYSRLRVARQRVTTAVRRARLARPTTNQPAPPRTTPPPRTTAPAEGKSDGSP